MPAYPRHEIVADDRVGLYHCIVRCVRRAFLCGDDPVSGKNHDHHIELEKYLSLVDWTGRELRAGSRGTIPGPLSPILDRLGQSGECWLETVRHFGRWFKRAAGGRDSLAAAAMRCGRRWFQGQCAAKIAFQ
jgi:hypothetical protein